MNDTVRSRPWSARISALLCCVGLIASASAQQKVLTLDESLTLAKERNGLVRAALFNVRAAQARTRQSAAALYPQITPTTTYQTTITNFQNGPGERSRYSQSSLLDITGSFRILDSGQRSYNLGSVRFSALSTERSSLQTLRNVLFSVHQQYYDTLRAQELLAVQETTAARAETILEQTRRRVELQDAPRKDILQAQADALNSRASVLAARNFVTNQQANLKATIGWPATDPLPQLQQESQRELGDPPMTLEEAYAAGIRDRADLQALRFDIESTRADLRLAQVQAGVTWNVDVLASKRFGRDLSDETSLLLQATVPLYDAGRSREAVNAVRFNIQSQQQNLVQTERDVRAEIEATFKDYQSNRERLTASSAALDASRLNFTAASEAQQAGAATLIDVLTAQVSLVTAESNYVQALYDALISRVRLRLASGQPLPGEQT